MIEMTQAEVDAAIRVAEKVHAQAPNANPQAAFLARAVLHLARQMPELRWEGNECYLGTFEVGWVHQVPNGTWCGVILSRRAEDDGWRSISHYTPAPEARTAVEAAVRKELGMSP